jgi:hypothetical protein
LLEPAANADDPLAAIITNSSTGGCYYMRITKAWLNFTTSVCIAFVLGLLLCFSQARADERAESLAAEASGAWLELIDEGKYEDSWETAATYFRNAIGREQWARSLKAVREPLGKVLDRRLVKATYSTSLPGAPDGEYVVIQYETDFEHKKSSIETVTPMMDEDGKWRVSGYYIR